MGVIVIGAFWATGSFVASVWRRSPLLAEYRKYRANLGRAILLGLEFLVAGDIIGTIMVDKTLESVGVLAVIVLIRTFLSFSLETEIEGMPPWRRAESMSES